MKIQRFLELSPLFTIYTLNEKIFGPEQQDLKKSGMTFIQALILTAIYFEKQDVHPSHLAETLGTSPSNISHSLKVLISKKWLQRSKNSTDARQTILNLTTEGKKKAIRLIKVFDSLQGAFEEELGEKSVALWNRKAQKMIQLYQRDNESRD